MDDIVVLYMADAKYIGWFESWLWKKLGRKEKQTFDPDGHYAPGWFGSLPTSEWESGNDLALLAKDVNDCLF